MTTTTTPVADERAAILAALDRFIRRRPGLDPRDYGTGMDGWRAYRSEVRSIAKDLHHARALLRFVELHPSITLGLLKESFRAYSGRLSWDGEALSYCAGQYMPTEYRPAVCAVLAMAIWYWHVANIRDERRAHGITDEDDNREGFSYGLAVRRWARREFGRGIGSRWFN